MCFQGFQAQVCPPPLVDLWLPLVAGSGKCRSSLASRYMTTYIVSFNERVSMLRQRAERRVSAF